MYILATVIYFLYFVLHFYNFNVHKYHYSLPNEHKRKVSLQNAACFGDAFQGYFFSLFEFMEPQY